MAIRNWSREQLKLAWRLGLGVAIAIGYLMYPLLYSSFMYTPSFTDRLTSGFTVFCVLIAVIILGTIHWRWAKLHGRR